MSFTLRSYQEESVKIGVDFFHNKKEKKNGLIILPTGSGKSVVIANIAGQTEGKKIILQPSKEILEQNFQKYTRYGYRAAIYSASAGVKKIDDVTFATIGSIINKRHLFEEVSSIIIDECFPPGTLIDGTPIEQLQPGILVRSFNHNTGSVELKPVVRLFKNVSKTSLVKVILSGGASFVCTSNHPVYTRERGYISAGLIQGLTVIQHEQEEDISLYGLRERMQAAQSQQKKHLLQRGMYTALQGGEERKGGNQLLKVREGDDSSGLFNAKLQEDREGILFKRVRQSCSVGISCGSWALGQEQSRMEEESIRSNEGEEPHVDTGYNREYGGGDEGKNFYRQRWQWPAYQTADDPSLGNSLSNGVRDRYRAGEGFVPVSTKLLQGGFGVGGKADSHRGGWRIPQAKEVEVSGQEEDGNIRGARVESIEVYEPGSRCEREALREKDYVYNIEVADNHNYFVANTLVHNCHLVNPEEGMYHKFIKSYDKVKVLGLTATPYRLASGVDGAQLRFLNRTSPRIFNKVLYYVQNDTLFNAGHLAPLEYFANNVIDRSKLQTNSTGADFTDSSLRAYYRQINMPAHTIRYANRLLARRNSLLVFCSLISEAEEVSKGVPGSVMISGETDATTRARILTQFKAGKIRCVVNVGVLTTGFDYPELEAVLIARSTMSLALYYQIIGRVMRPFTYPDGRKKTGLIMDLGGNVDLFGKIETMRIYQNDKGLFSIWNNGRQLTNTPFQKTIAV